MNTGPFPSISTHLSSIYSGLNQEDPPPVRLLQKYLW